MDLPTLPPIPPGLQVEFESLKQVLLDFSREQRIQSALDCLVRRLAEDRPRSVRVCVWLRSKVARDLGYDVPEEESEPDLFLAASARKNPDPTFEEWPHAQGDFRRLPLDELLVGRYVEAGKLFFCLGPEEWEDYPDWASREGVRSYVVAPLEHRDQPLGALAIFAGQSSEAIQRGRTPLSDEQMEQARQWMLLFGDHTSAVVANALAFAEIEALRKQLENENEYLREEVSHFHSSGSMVGQSVALKRVLEQVAVVAPTDVSTLILGESGTGKELVARAIHENSELRDHPLIKVNCASVPGELFESEFFGHVQGAFTGALRDRAGRFELADGGTLFLDEVGEIPLPLQAKLLRVLQEGEFERIGEEKTRKVRVRVIAASNRDLKKEVERKKFRPDLYYRLSVFPIEVPPLRERREDIPLLAAHFMEQACRRLGIPNHRLTREHVRVLQGYAWPGNIRELQNVVEHAAVLSRTQGLKFHLEAAAVPASAEAGGGPSDSVRPMTYPSLKELERKTVLNALEQTDWRVSGEGGAAELLAVKPTTLFSRMRAMGIKKAR